MPSNMQKYSTNQVFKALFHIVMQDAYANKQHLPTSASASDSTRHVIFPIRPKLFILP